MRLKSIKNNQKHINDKSLKELLLIQVIKHNQKIEIKNYEIIHNPLGKA
jgi:hypothetical protein